MLGDEIKARSLADSTFCCLDDAIHSFIRSIICSCDGQLDLINIFVFTCWLAAGDCIILPGAGIENLVNYLIISSDFSIQEVDCIIIHLTTHTM